MILDIQALTIFDLQTYEESGVAGLGKASLKHS
jgi:hypothetical protein